MQIGIYLVKDVNLTPEDKLPLLKEVGFDFVCLGMSHMTEEFLALCAEYGLPVENVHLTGKKTSSIWYDDEVGEQVVTRYCNEITHCSSLGVHTGIVHVTWGVHDIPAVTEKGLVRLSRIADHAEKHGFTIAIENSASEPHFRYALDNLDSPNIRFCFDSGHRNAFAPDADFLGDYGHRLGALHLQDNDGVKDLHLIPFDGCAPWEEITDKLARIPYSQEKICAEIAGYVVRERPGESAEEIRRSLSRVAVASDNVLTTIHDGGYEVYSALSHKEILERAYAALSRMAQMIEAKRRSFNA